MAGRRWNRHLRQMRRRMVWYYQTHNEQQAEDKPKPVAYYFEPEITDHFKDAKQSETTSYFEIDLVEKLQANKDIDANK